MFLYRFDLPKLNSTFHEILLRFRLTNPTSVNAITLFPMLFIDGVSILKSGNILGYDINGEDILFHNYIIQCCYNISFNFTYTNSVV